MRQLLTIILLTLLALTGPARAQTTQPVAYSAYLSGGASLDVGMPRVVQVEDQWWAAKVELLRKTDAAALLDYEPTGTIWGMPGSTLARTTARASIAEINAWGSGCSDRLARLRAELPTRRILLFTNWPVGRSWQYPEGKDQSAFIAANRRLARTGAFDLADAVVVHVYLSGEDKGWMTAEDAAEVTRRRIAAAEAALPEGKSLVIALCQDFVDFGGSVPADWTGAQYAVVRAAGHGVIWWMPNVTQPQANAKAKAAREAMVAKR